MKSLYEYLAEEEGKKKTKTKTQDKPNPDLSKMFEPKADQPLAKRDEPKQDEPKQDEPQAPELKKASQSDTLRKTSGLANPRMADLLGRMRDIEADPDDAGYPTQEPETLPSTRVNTDNLPSVASRALAADGVQDPEWHKVANLPGNMSRAIRTLGKHLFGAMTTTPTDQIHMIGNLGGRGPNTTQEINAVANWVRQHGEDLGDGNIDFDTTIPGYNADIKQYSAAGIRWLLVRDEFGNYIYSWPEQDSVEHTNTPALGHDRPRLPNR
jgi:hypothetical protein